MAATETTLEVNESLSVDATTGVPIEGGIVGGGTGGNTVSVEVSGLDNSPFLRDRPVVVMVEPEAGANDVTSEEGVQTVTEGF